MVTNQKHSSDSVPSEQEVIRHTGQNAEVYSALSGEIAIKARCKVLEEKLDDYHRSLKKSVKH
jgi:hypothetical protein